MMLYTELEAAVHAMIQRLEYSFTFIASQLFKALASALARISKQMMLRQKSPLAPAIDQIKSLSLWSELWSKPNEASL